MPWADFDVDERSGGDIEMADFGQSVGTEVANFEATPTEALLASNNEANVQVSESDIQNSARVGQVDVPAEQMYADVKTNSRIISPNTPADTETSISRNNGNLAPPLTDSEKSTLTTNQQLAKNREIYRQNNPRFRPPDAQGSQKTAPPLMEKRGQKRKLAQELNNAVEMTDMNAQARQTASGANELTSKKSRDMIETVSRQSGNLTESAEGQVGQQRRSQISTVGDKRVVSSFGDEQQGLSMVQGARETFNSYWAERVQNHNALDKAELGFHYNQLSAKDVIDQIAETVANDTQSHSDSLAQYYQYFMDVPDDVSPEIKGEMEKYYVYMQALPEAEEGWSSRDMPDHWFGKSDTATADGLRDDTAFSERVASKWFQKYYWDGVSKGEWDTKYSQPKIAANDLTGKLSDFYNREAIDAVVLGENPDANNGMGDGWFHTYYRSADARITDPISDHKRLVIAYKRTAYKLLDDYYNNARFEYTRMLNANKVTENATQNQSSLVAQTDELGEVTSRDAVSALYADTTVYPDNYDDIEVAGAEVGTQTTERRGLDDEFAVVPDARRGPLESSRLGGRQSRTGGVVNLFRGREEPVMVESTGESTGGMEQYRTPRRDYEAQMKDLQMYLEGDPETGARFGDHLIGDKEKEIMQDKYRTVHRELMQDPELKKNWPLVMEYIKVRDMQNSHEMSIGVIERKYGKPAAEFVNRGSTQRLAEDYMQMDDIFESFREQYLESKKRIEKLRRNKKVGWYLMTAAGGAVLGGSGRLAADEIEHAAHDHSTSAGSVTNPINVITGGGNNPNGVNAATYQLDNQIGYDVGQKFQNEQTGNTFESGSYSGSGLPSMGTVSLSEGVGEGGVVTLPSLGPISQAPQGTADFMLNYITSSIKDQTVSPTMVLSKIPQLQESGALPEIVSHQLQEVCQDADLAISKAVGSAQLELQSKFANDMQMIITLLAGFQFNSNDNSYMFQNLETKLGVMSGVWSRLAAIVGPIDDSCLLMVRTDEWQSLGGNCNARAMNMQPADWAISPFINAMPGMYQGETTAADQLTGSSWYQTSTTN